MPRHRSVVAVLILNLIPLAALTLMPPSWKSDAKGLNADGVSNVPRGPTVEPAGTPHQPGLEMAQVAGRFPRHHDPTFLYLNFDGWRAWDKAGHRIYPFEGPTNNRERDIQEILYRVAEIFDAFDVRVVRIFGDGAHDARPLGNTTIFIGANTADIDKDGRKYPHYWAPKNYSDYPSRFRGTDHRPNSDPFDLAYVDPMAPKKGQRRWVCQGSNVGLARTIAHEAGHTFGLAHVSSHPERDIMSYNSAQWSFVNRSFPVSVLNFDPKEKKKKPNEALLPRWRDRPITTQNSFATLWYLLGRRPRDDYPNVADPLAVDPTYPQPPIPEVAVGSAQQAAINPRGDYDVFRVRAAGNSPLEIRVLPAPRSQLDPVLFVLDARGQKVLRFSQHSPYVPGERGCVVRIAALPGQSYRLVVGAVDGATTGNYLVQVSEVEETVYGRQGRTAGGG